MTYLYCFIQIEIDNNKKIEQISKINLKKVILLLPKKEHLLGNRNLPEIKRIHEKKKRIQELTLPQIQYKN